MRDDVIDLLDEASRSPVPPVDVAELWARSRRRRRRRVAAGAVSVVAVIAGAGAIWMTVPSPSGVVVGQPAAPEAQHPVAIVRHELGDPPEVVELLWRAGCPIPDDADLIPGNPVGVDVDRDGAPDLPMAGSCNDGRTIAPPTNGEQSADPLDELRRKLALSMQERAEMVTLLQHHRTQLAGEIEDTDAYRSLEERVASLEALLGRLDGEIAALERRLANEVGDRSVRSGEDGEAMLRTEGGGRVTITTIAEVDEHVEFELRFPERLPGQWREAWTVVIRRDWDGDGQVDIRWVETVWTPSGAPPGEGEFVKLRQTVDAGPPQDRAGWPEATIAGRYRGWLMPDGLVRWSQAEAYYELNAAGLTEEELLELAERVATAKTR